MRFWLWLVLLLAAGGVASPASAAAMFDAGNAWVAGAGDDKHDESGAGDALSAILDEPALGFPRAPRADVIVRQSGIMASDGIAIDLRPARSPLERARRTGGIGSIIGLGGPVLAAPEPGMWLMLVSGFGLIGLTMRRRRGMPSPGYAQII